VKTNAVLSVVELKYVVLCHKTDDSWLWIGTCCLLTTRHTWSVRSKWAQHTQ